MVTLTEPMLLCIAAGTAVFAWASLRVLGAEARRQTDLCEVAMEARRMREEYVAQLRAIREGAESKRGESRGNERAPVAGEIAPDAAPAAAA